MTDKTKPNKKATNVRFYPIRDPLRYEITKIQILLRILNKRIEYGDIENINFKDYLMLLDKHKTLLRDYYAKKAKTRTDQGDVEKVALPTGQTTLRQNKHAGLDL